MDANRNLTNYILENSDKIDEFIGDAKWRNSFKLGQLATKDFIKFLAQKYDMNMKGIDYKEPVKKHLVRIDDIRVPLYYLAFYSKHERGNDFYQKVEKYLSNQQFEFAKYRLGNRRWRKREKSKTSRKRLGLENKRTM